MSKKNIKKPSLKTVVKKNKKNKIHPKIKNKDDSKKTNMEGGNDIMIHALLNSDIPDERKPD